MGAPSPAAGGEAAGPKGAETSPNGAPGRGTAQARDDEDGFTEVVRRRRGPGPQPAATEPEQGAAATSAARAERGPSDDVERRAGTLAADDDVDMDGEEEFDEGAAEEDDGGGEEESPAVLKQKFDQETAMVHWLEREGVAEGHPSMVAAVRARDAAEQRWKETRRPQPVAKRMGWAQSKLDRALRQQDRVREELAIFDREVQLQREKIVQKLDEARTRVSKHREALEDLQEEAGALAPSAKRGGVGKAVCAQVVSGLRDTVAPNVSALAAVIPDGTAARAKLETLMGHLAEIQQRLEGVARGEGAQGTPPHETFDIATDERSEAEWSESHELDGGGAPTAAATGGRREAGATDSHWQAKGHGRWGKGTGGIAGAGTGGGGGDDKEHPVARRINGGEHAITGRGTHGDDEGGDPRAAKHRRGQTAEDSEDAVAAVQGTRNAVELMAQQAAAASAATLQLAGQQYAQRVSEVTQRAIAQGVQPLTEEGQDLIMLAPSDLDTWVATHLKGEGA